MAVTNYIWDDLSDNILLETDENGAVTAQYTNEPGLFGAPISQHRNGETSFFCFDGDGATRQVTDSDQNVTDTETFTAYGEEVFKMGAMEYPFRYKGIAGYYTDVETGEIYVRARTYKPPIGRWLSPDPLGFSDGVNLYAAYFVPYGLDQSGTRAIPAPDRCCCCASDVRFKQQPLEQQAFNGAPGIGATFIIEFETKWDHKIVNPTIANENNDCQMIWNERSIKGLKWPKHIRDKMIQDVKDIFDKDVTINAQEPRKWYDQHREYWFLQMFKPWRERNKPCPEVEVTAIEDTPGIWGQAGKNVIQFELILKSSPNCECDHAQTKLCFEFYAEVRRNGAFEWKWTPVECTPTKIPAFKY